MFYKVFPRMLLCVAKQCQQAQPQPSCCLPARILLCPTSVIMLAEILQKFTIAEGRVQVETVAGRHRSQTEPFAISDFPSLHGNHLIHCWWRPPGKGRHSGHCYQLICRVGAHAHALQEHTIYVHNDVQVLSSVLL